MVLTASYPLAYPPRDSILISKLESTGCYESQARFSVTHSPERKRCGLHYQSRLCAGSADPLAPCDYLTDWSLETPTGTVNGFSAYFNGHHYRYHNEPAGIPHGWDSIPFMPVSFCSAGAATEML